MESLNSDIENNRRIAVIEESINRALLYDDYKKDDNKCKNLMLPITILIAISIIVMVIVVVIFIFKKI
jgi:hypothetical protein